MHHEITACRICGNTTLDPILDLGNQHLTGVFPGVADRDPPRSPLQLVKCSEAAGRESCGLVQLRHSCNRASIFGDRYGYRSGSSSFRVAHLAAIAQSAARLAPPRPGDLVVDIGSNDGTLLRQFPLSDGLTLVGVDPGAARLRNRYPPHIQLIPDYFSADRLRGRKARIVFSIAMLHDLESPLDFMRQVRSLLADDGVWVFEQSYLPRVLEQNAYDAICHEHLEYYLLRQIYWLTSRSDLKILKVEFNESDGGSFAVTAAPSCAPFAGNKRLVEDTLLTEQRELLRKLAPYLEFARRVREHRERLRSFLAGARASGRIVGGYGASSQGNVILQYCGITQSQIPWIADVNEEMSGLLTPGTRIPIVSEERARVVRPDYLVVFPWRFRSHTIDRETDYLAAGGTLLFPLPGMEQVGGLQSASCRKVEATA